MSNKHDKDKSEADITQNLELADRRAREDALILTQFVIRVLKLMFKTKEPIGCEDLIEVSVRHVRWLPSLKVVVKHEIVLSIVVQNRPQPRRQVSLVNQTVLSEP